MDAYKCPFNNILVIDFTTTLEENTFDHPPEIIQFSVSVLDIKNKSIREDISFNEYCKPSLHPIRTDYCVRTTGVQQTNVDSALPFREVYAQFVEWVEEHNFEEKQFAIACHSQETIWKNAQYQFILDNTPLPAILRQWIDIPFVYFGIISERQFVPENNLARMAAHFGIELQGEIFDSRSNVINLARILKRMLDDGRKVDVNSRVMCADLSRNYSLFFQKNIIWQKDRELFFKIMHRILPLSYRKTNVPFTMDKYAKCMFCNEGPAICTGLEHKQIPSQLYRDFLETSHPVSRFAVALDLGE